MALEIPYRNLRKRLDAVLDQVVNDRETVIVRRGVKRVAMVAADELAGIMATVQMRNAQRSSTAVRRSEKV